MLSALNPPGFSKVKLDNRYLLRTEHLKGGIWQVLLIISFWDQDILKGLYSFSTARRLESINFFVFNLLLQSSFKEKWCRWKLLKRIRFKFHFFPLNYRNRNFWKLFVNKKQFLKMTKSVQWKFPKTLLVVLYMRMPAGFIPDNK